MKFIMSLVDVVVIPNIGSVIVGSNPEITKYDTSKLCRIGDSIVVEHGEEELVFKVIDIKLSFSLTENVIISMQLEESKDFSKLSSGDLVYKN